MRSFALGSPVDKHAESKTDVKHWDKIATVATGITITRAVIASSMFVHVANSWSPSIYVMAVVVFYAGDLLDGAVARGLRRETRFGALADLMADRLSGLLMVVTYMAHHNLSPISLVVFGLVAFQLDSTLAASFLRFGLLSPNYFYMVSPTIWKWDFSRSAKFLHGAMAPFVAIFAPVVLVVTWGVLSATVRICSLRSLRMCDGRLTASSRSANQPPAEIQRS